MVIHHFKQDHIVRIFECLRIVSAKFDVGIRRVIGIEIEGNNLVFDEVFLAQLVQKVLTWLYDLVLSKWNGRVWTDTNVATNRVGCKVFIRNYLHDREDVAWVIKLSIVAADREVQVRLSLQTRELEPRNAAIMIQVSNFIGIWH